MPACNLHNLKGCNALTLKVYMTKTLCAYVLTEINVENLVLFQATVGFTIFGKESLVDLDLNEIIVETK
ncbi:hypothetical protein L484_023630 [Morus notabilis]|uniref:Uncharacterized protein n=1 Tax=Morus notabilis TaxID=981085 RepID=W9RPM0_9ROSA|nr:hypothetical protein L484_023630 [Morus notabilis]